MADVFLDAGRSIEDFVDYGEGEGEDGLTSKVVGEIDGIGFSITVYATDEARARADESQLSALESADLDGISLIAACGPISFVSGTIEPTPEEEAAVRGLIDEAERLLGASYGPC